MWHCKTDIGVFWIRFDPRTRSRFLLGIGEEPLGWYYSPEAAADVVFLQETGWSEWDSRSRRNQTRGPWRLDPDRLLGLDTASRSLSGFDSLHDDDSGQGPLRDVRRLGAAANGVDLPAGRSDHPVDINPYGFQGWS